MSRRSDHRSLEQPRKTATPTRRWLLRGALAMAPMTMGQAGRVVAAPAIIINDVTRLNPVYVDRILTPRTTKEIQDCIKDWRGPISIGGARYSMGGQIASEASLHIDLRNFNQLVALNVERRIVRVQSGMRWRDLQTFIDPAGLSVKIMQSYANFSIGGALSVNAHGRYVGLGPVINSVRSIQLVLPGGEVVEADRQRNPEIFFGAIGGYGALGIITEAELDLAPNVRMERSVMQVSAKDYPSFFRDQILRRDDAIFHNADLLFPNFDQALSVTWFKTDKPATIPESLRPSGKSAAFDAAATWLLGEIPNAQAVRRLLYDPIRYRSQPVIWRNYEASLDVAILGQFATEASTYALQEYFIPLPRFEEFTQAMSRILQKNDVNALNVSVRHSPADTNSLLAWAQEEVFSFVLFYKQGSSISDQKEVGVWTRELIVAALSMQGTYYLPYQLHATRQQFEQAYPRLPQFLGLKQKVDPLGQFRNKMWDKYYFA